MLSDDFLRALSSTCPRGAASSAGHIDAVQQQVRQRVASLVRLPGQYPSAHALGMDLGTFSLDASGRI